MLELNPFHTLIAFGDIFRLRCKRPPKERRVNLWRINAPWAYELPTRGFSDQIFEIQTHLITNS
jgi:hypothetical protein